MTAYKSSYYGSRIFLGVKKKIKKMNVAKKIIMIFKIILKKIT